MEVEAQIKPLKKKIFLERQVFVADKKDILFAIIIDLVKKRIGDRFSKKLCFRLIDNFKEEE